MRDLESRLQRELARRGDALHGAPLTFADVAGRARLIRRRRRSAALAGAALAIAAIAVPAALIAPSATDRGGPPPASRTPRVVDADGVAIPFVREGVLHRGDSSVLRLPGRDWQDMTELADGQIVLSRSAGTGREAMIVLPGGDTLPTPLSGSVVANADRTAAAWAAPDGTVVGVRAGSEELIDFGSGGLTDASVVALAGDCVEKSDCTVVVEGTNENGEAVAYPGSPSPVADFAMLPVDRVDDLRLDGERALVAGQDSEGCSGVWEWNGTPAWAQPSCDLSGLRFAPDGRHLYAVDAEVEGLGPTRAYVVGAGDGAVAATLEPRGTILDMAWESDSDVLAVVARPEGEVLVRFGLDGSSEDVIGPVPGGDVGAPTLMLP